MYSYPCRNTIQEHHNQRRLLSGKTTGQSTEEEEGPLLTGNEHM